MFLKEVVVPLPTGTVQPSRNIYHVGSESWRRRGSQPQENTERPPTVLSLVNLQSEAFSGKILAWSIAGQGRELAVWLCPDLAESQDEADSPASSNSSHTAVFYFEYALVPGTEVTEELSCAELRITALDASRNLFVLQFQISELLGTGLGKEGGSTEWLHVHSLSTRTNREIAFVNNDQENSRVYCASKAGQLLISQIDRESLELGRLKVTDHELFDESIRRPTRSVVPYLSRLWNQQPDGSLDIDKTAFQPVSIASTVVRHREHNSSAGHVFVFCRNRTLQFWSVSTQTCLRTAQISASTMFDHTKEHPSSDKRRAIGIDGAALRREILPLSDAPRRFLFAAPAPMDDSDETVVTYLYVYSPAEPKPFLVVYRVEESRDQSEIMHIDLMKRIVCMPGTININDRLVQGELVDMKVVYLEHEQCHQVWMLWQFEEACLAYCDIDLGELESTPVEDSDDDNGSQGTDDESGNKWISVDMHQRTDPAEIEQLRETSGNVSDKFLNFVTSPGRYSVSTLLQALKEGDRSGASGSKRTESYAASTPPGIPAAIVRHIAQQTRDFRKLTRRPVDGGDIQRDIVHFWVKFIRHCENLTREQVSPRGLVVRDDQVLVVRHGMIGLLRSCSLIEVIDAYLGFGPVWDDERASLFCNLPADSLVDSFAFISPKTMRQDLAVPFEAHHILARALSQLGQLEIVHKRIGEYLSSGGSSSGADGDFSSTKAGQTIAASLGLIDSQTQKMIFEKLGACKNLVHIMSLLLRIIADEQHGLSEEDETQLASILGAGGELRKATGFAIHILGSVWNEISTARMNTIRDMFCLLTFIQSRRNKYDMPSNLTEAAAREIFEQSFVMLRQYNITSWLAKQPMANVGRQAPEDLLRAQQREDDRETESVDEQEAEEEPEDAVSRMMSMHIAGASRRLTMMTGLTSQMAQAMASSSLLHVLLARIGVQIAQPKRLLNIPSSLKLTRIIEGCINSLGVCNNTVTTTFANTTGMKRVARAFYESNFTVFLSGYLCMLNRDSASIIFFYGLQYLADEKYSEAAECFTSAFEKNGTLSVLVTRCSESE